MDDDDGAVTPTRDENSDIEHSNDEVTNASDNEKSQEIPGDVEHHDRFISPDGSDEINVNKEESDVEDKQNTDDSNSPTSPDNEDDLNSPSSPQNKDDLNSPSSPQNKDDLNSPSSTQNEDDLNSPSSPQNKDAINSPTSSQDEEDSNNLASPHNVNDENVTNPSKDDINEEKGDVWEGMEEGHGNEEEEADEGAKSESNKESAADGNTSAPSYEENQTEGNSSEIESEQKDENEEVNENLEDSQTGNDTSQESIENTHSGRTSFENTAEISNQDELQSSLADDMQSVGSVENDKILSPNMLSQVENSNMEGLEPQTESEPIPVRNIEGSDIESDEDMNGWDEEQSKQSVEEEEMVTDSIEHTVRENEDSMDVDDYSKEHLVTGTDEVSSDDENETLSNKEPQSDASQGNEVRKRENDEEIVGKIKVVDNPLSPAEDISDSEAGELSDDEEGGEKEEYGDKDDDIDDWDLDLTKKGDNVQNDRPFAETEDINSPESDLAEREKTPVRDLESAASPISEDGNLSDIDMDKRRREMYNDISDEEESFSDDEKVDVYKVDNVVKEAIRTNEGTHKRTEVKRDRNIEKFHSQSSMSEEQVELDYDEEVGDEDGRGHEDKEKMDESRAGENEVEKKETEEGEAQSDDGELDDDEDCEEGEIREPGTRKPFIPPICRFFTRGVCTWGNNCRFIHPGVNDKGNYRMIERSEFGPSNYGQGSGPWQGPGEKPATEDIEEEELPPPPMPPKVETAWERGLRHAKEQLKKANMRKEQETDFEHKRLNLSVEEERELNKENDRYKNVHKDPYYDQYDDEYYDKLPSKRSPSPIGWQHGQYENFEVRWTREPEWVPPPPVPHYHREREHQKFIREPFPVRHPAERFERKPASHRNKQWVEEPPPRETRETPIHRHTADVWHDPWRRSKSPKKKPRGSRSRSRGRRRSRRSYSYSSSFSSSSFSGSSRSRSRSSSYSSYSSRSSGSRTSSSSRSPTRSPLKHAGGPQGRQPQNRQPQNRQPQNRPPQNRPPQNRQPQNRQQQNRQQQNRPPPFKADSGKPRSAVSGPPGLPGPIRRQTSQNQGGPQGKLPSAGPPLDRQRSQPGIQGGPPQEPDRGRTPKNKAGPPPPLQPPQRVPQPQRPSRQKRRHSSSSRSRSRSSSSGSSRSSSASSVSSVSSHSSSSSSGSADSEHLYRGVGGAKEGSPVSPKKKKVKTAKGLEPPANKVEKKPTTPMGSRSSKGSRNEPSQAPVTSKPKDPLKVVGSKQNIKLTLLNKPAEKEKPSGLGSKKRPSTDLDVPPAKRPAIAVPSQPKPDKKVKKPDKPVSTAPPTPPVKAAPPPRPTPATKNPPKGPQAVAPPPKEKKSTSSRREELLKQLKAVEDAIARKRSKMN
ncbi:zinc finger CCCH domain-containing protein 18-like isoform X2 [Ostrea edulis]|uniref:zinc finger CCCH domain-containing protein 18-like isoform X2 n=1 Tax=Ostrea edulis TaxID=37623 RepID=UPI0024AF5082|nr:zinc finger CCCH domain-containing protein 18-like isoform X2 [Ostrea edulis]